MSELAIFHLVLSKLLKKFVVTSREKAIIEIH